MTTIGLGSDSAGVELRRLVADHLRSLGHEVLDVGVDDDSRNYPSIAFEVAENVAARRYDRAILICGTGLGVAIAANKIPGVYAATCHDTYSARRARKSNNAQILTMGARVIGPMLALEIVDAWLDSEFDGGGSVPKVQELSDGEERYAQARQ
ncbi:RpiB/LacA/LacB family sugar-phosphate isomerase [Conexibacter woesei]|uniref:Sugar-phosphate isomerase, RpiB/LacA/LacB family n=1 Tax=Conexibacter woesei (strain DSM 14684 / CCUG 47730 / CIP 108061 / JCM 11494 / NBRC 100937 / ID131577) TaxID=469383 RepID=D3F989_CONWI|nr:RpiB/LacA/LacB family sugar-phosphate isomerase [Conexibacter woesei]ADB49056.1 sugar-phosphate isomerase, RpiB/LacA/LacB family [Conexibacter woesei DSM 14684]